VCVYIYIYYRMTIKTQYQIGYGLTFSAQTSEKVYGTLKLKRGVNRLKEKQNTTNKSFRDTWPSGDQFTL
jgi:hypothetical protein